jgi:hypothetical protein
MRDVAITLSSEQKNDLLRRYRSRPVEEVTYGTVRDFCDSSDHLPFLSHLQGDLKDLQRPAAVKAILGLVPPGARLLEVGAGEPVVAHTLSQLGYQVTIVDPYDGSGNGPTEFNHYVAMYPHIPIIRSVFTKDVSGLQANSFDCIYSISVLEHVYQPAALSGLFGGIASFLKKGGYSLHLIDHVLAGEGAEYHIRHLTEILTLQASFAGKDQAQVHSDVATLIANLQADIETYYLSAEGHNNWRGATPYESFPFRKVISVQSFSKRVGSFSK